MIRTSVTSVVAVLGIVLAAMPVGAQVYVRVPFVQVETGNGVYVRAPFVRVWVPRSYVVPPPATIQVVPAQPAPPIFVPNPPTVIVPQQPVPPQPLVEPTNIAPAAPQPLQTRYPTVQEFANSFQPRAGQYNVTIVNPLTGQPVAVQFSLPEGSPRRVIVDNDEIEFRYSLRQFVRIEFTRNGVVVTNRQ